jgi:hypothetical protein
MRYDEDKVDDTALALLFLTTFEQHTVTRAWKGLAWEVADRLYEKGYIGDPKGKAKSVVLTEEGARRSRELFGEFFGLSD